MQTDDELLTFVDERESPLAAVLTLYPSEDKINSRISRCRFSSWRPSR